MEITANSYNHNKPSHTTLIVLVIPVALTVPNLMAMSLKGTTTMTSKGTNQTLYSVTVRGAHPPAIWLFVFIPVESPGGVAQSSSIQTQCLVLQFLSEADPLHPPLHHHLPPHQGSIHGNLIPRSF